MQPAGAGMGEACSGTLGGGARAFHGHAGAPTRARGAPTREWGAPTGARGARSARCPQTKSGPEALALETACVLALAASRPA
jgi:hypothetical protein